MLLIGKVHRYVKRFHASDKADKGLEMEKQTNGN